MIAGLSLGTVVVEAALRSGSISTANHALNSGREVFAVPGAVGSSVSAGCRRLIRDGATLVEGCHDIVEALSLTWSLSARKPAAGKGIGGPPVSEQEKGLLDTAGWSPFTIDDVVAQTGLTVSEVSSILLDLELRGFLEFQVAGTYQRLH